MASGTIKTDRYSSVSNSPLYFLNHNTPFTVPCDGYIRVNVNGILGFYNSNDNTYAALCVNRPNGGQFAQCIFVKKGLSVRWDADDSSSYILFFRCV